MAATSAFSQSTKFVFDFEKIKGNNNLPQREALWLRDNLSESEKNEVFNLLSTLSQPSASQLLIGHFYLDGSYQRKSIKPYVDSLAVRPPDGEAGLIRVAYLVSKLRKDLIDSEKTNPYYTAQFISKPIKIPEYNESKINKNIDLSFDYEPALVVLNILSKSNVSYEEILEKVNLHPFNELISHHNQSFYTTPLNKERLASCLQIATSTKPIDLLYKYVNPDGLLYFTDVKNNLEQYEKLLTDLSINQVSIFKYINATISPFLPAATTFSRKVSFFFINDADGWTSNGVTAIDINYFKDDYQKLLPLLAHETYHSGQHAVAITDTIKRDENVQLFVDGLYYLTNEGTATYVAPPSIKTLQEKETEIKKGISLFEEVYLNVIVEFNSEKAQELADVGFASGGPFYWLGGEMTRVIVENSGKEKLASIIPYGGITFFKTYLDAVGKSKDEKNIFSSELSNYIFNIR
jgi:hypothetical protein